jgi:hypothetical protein
MIESAMTRRPTSGNEVSAAVESAYSGRKSGADMRWPERDLEAIAGLLGVGNGIAALEERSPVKDAAQNEVLSALFRPGELICTGWDVTRPRVEPFDMGGDYSRDQFIVANPMTARHGLTVDGRVAVRAKSNTGARRRLVIEFDFSEEDAVKLEAHPWDVCAAVLWRMTEWRPLACVVHSAGKSLHGWFPLVAPGESEAVYDGSLWRLMAWAIRHGADRATWKREQWLRMPGGVRRDEWGDVIERDGRPLVQRVVYFDPAVNVDVIERGAL